MSGRNFRDRLSYRDDALAFAKRRLSADPTRRKY
jgi:hypothetical protein